MYFHFVIFSQVPGIFLPPLKKMAEVAAPATKMGQEMPSLPFFYLTLVVWFSNEVLPMSEDSAYFLKEA